MAVKKRYAKYEVTINLSEIDAAVIEPINLAIEIEHTLENVGWTSADVTFIGEIE